MFQTKILARVKARQEDAHWWEQFWWYCSIVLFVIGWGLTLVGKLAKDDRM